MKTTITDELIRSLASLKTKKTAVEMRAIWAVNPAMAVAWQAAMIVNGKRKLLSVNQAKLDKSGKTIGVLTVGLTMSPADEAAPFIILPAVRAKDGHARPPKRGQRASRKVAMVRPIYTACAGSTAACRAVCVGNATGQAAISALMPFDGHLLARLGRTILRHYCRDLFDVREAKELAAARRKADRLGYGLAYRPDVATDYQDGRQGADIDMVYGYTAISSAMRRDDGTLRAFSRKDTATSDRLARRWVSEGFPVAVVFAVKKGQPLPATWHGAPVIDGDLHDVWPMQDNPTTGAPISDSYGQHGVVVGLRMKYANNGQRDAIISTGFAVAA